MRLSLNGNATAMQWGANEDPSAGYIAWLLRGGNDSEAWAARRRAKLFRTGIIPGGILRCPTMSDKGCR
jgi:hypothetical protein